MASEVPREMCLVMEADLDGDLGRGLSFEEQLPSGVDPASHQVPVGRDPERPSEAPNEMRRRNVEDPPRLGQRHRSEAMRVQEIAERFGDRAIGAFRGLGHSAAEMLT